MKNEVEESNQFSKTTKATQKKTLVCVEKVIHSRAKFSSPRYKIKKWWQKYSLSRYLMFKDWKAQPFLFCISIFRMERKDRGDLMNWKEIVESVCGREFFDEQVKRRRKICVCLENHKAFHNSQTLPTEKKRKKKKRKRGIQRWMRFCSGKVSVVSFVKCRYIKYM